MTARRRNGVGAAQHPAPLLSRNVRYDASAVGRSVSGASIPATEGGGVADVVSLGDYRRRRRCARRLRRATVMAAAAMAAATAVFAADAATAHPSLATTTADLSTGNACALLTATTVARFVPGSGPGTPVPAGSCVWNGAASLEVTATASTGAGGYPITGAEPVPGLGDRARVTFTPAASGPSVLLITRSGNTEIQVSYTAGTKSQHATLVTAVTTITRDILGTITRRHLCGGYCTTRPERVGYP